MTMIHDLPSGEHYGDLDDQPKIAADLYSGGEYSTLNYGIYDLVSNYLDGVMAVENTSYDKLDSYFKPRIKHTVVNSFSTYPQDAYSDNYTMLMYYSTGFRSVMLQAFVDEYCSGGGGSFDLWSYLTNLEFADNLSYDDAKLCIFANTHEDSIYQITVNSFLNSYLVPGFWNVDVAYPLRNNQYVCLFTDHSVSKASLEDLAYWIKDYLEL